jgi:hypothetical protein
MNVADLPIARGKEYKREFREERSLWWLFGSPPPFPDVPVWVGAPSAGLQPSSVPAWRLDPRPCA